MIISRKIIVIGIPVVILLVLLFIIDRKINREVLKKERGDFVQLDGSPLKGKELSRQEKEIKRYHIGVLSEKAPEQSEMQWDYRTKEAVDQAEVFDSINENQSFKGRQKSIEEYEGRLERLDQRIKEYQDLLKKNPYDKEVKNHLDNLLQMKAIVSNLKPVIIEKDE